MKTGRTLWDELCYKYYSGSDSVKWMKTEWMKQVSKVDPQRHREVSMLLDIQLEESIWWRNACLLYFQTFSKMPLPPGYEKPNQTLDYYKSLRFPFAPGN
jgi:alpha-glucuronidase